MFDTFAKLLSSIPTFLFPVFASYKALKTSDPALLKPWLMYWVVLACALLAESWIGFILVWMPFYAWLRLFFLLYLILPQTQGAKVLYLEHVHPYLEKNEIAIDDLISSTHDRAKTAGLSYLKKAIDFVKQHAFGFPPAEPTPPPTPSTFSYAQSLLARFNLPAARPAFPSSQLGGASSTATDFYALLASAVSAASSGSALTSTNQPRDVSNSGTLIPPTVHGEERLSFIAAQRERLSFLLSALDKEANTLEGQTVKSPERPQSSLSSRKSEVDFVNIDAEGATEDAMSSAIRPSKRGQGSSGSWLSWGWGAKSQDTGEDTIMAEAAGTEYKGKSSGIEL